MANDNMRVEILADGTMTVTTDRISMANHLTAEKFLKFASDLLGGAVTSVRRIGVNIDLRDALHAHAADGHTHDHDHVHTH